MVPFPKPAQLRPVIAATIAGALVAAIVFQTIRIDGFLWIDGYRARLARAETTIAAMAAASRLATEQQVKVNQAPATIAGALAGKSNQDAPAYYDRVHRAATAAAGLRCPANQGSAGGADLPQPDPAQPGIHRPAGSAELVCRPAVEDRQLVAAAARAAEMHQQALDLIAAGVAVPAP